MTTAGQTPQGQNPQPGQPAQGIASRESLTVLPDGTKPIPLGSGTVSGILGEGGAAIVYEIWNEQLGVKRAVKILRPNAMPTSFERFTTEMRITAQLRHPNIIEIHSVGQWHHLPYIEMERLEGNSLDMVVEKNGALPVPVAIAIGLMIARALKYTHNHDYSLEDKRYRGILHRDLKPANVMLSQDGVVKLMDFGIATPTNASMHTMEGTFVGSLQYLAPEQLEGNRASTSTDLFALGAVMYEMLTGQQAFSEKNMTKLISMRLKNEYKPLQDYRLKMPKRLLRLVNRCMAHDKDRREQDAARVVAEFEAIFSAGTRMQPEELVEKFLHGSAGKRTIVYRRRLPVLRIAAGIALAAGLGYGGYWVWANQDDLSERFEPREIVREIVKRDSVLVMESAEPETVFVDKPSVAPKPLPKPRPVARPTPRPKPQPKPAPRPEPPRRMEPSFLVRLTEKYGTDDLVAIMALEVGQRNYGNALLVYDSLTSDQMGTKRALLYRMRALQGVGNRQQLGSFFSTHTVIDAEYYLGKAQYLYGRGRHREALVQLDNCKGAQAELTDPKSIQREVVYYRALALTGLYNRGASEQSLANAMDGWYNVKFAFRNEQNHRYFKYANEQIRKMSAESGDE